MKYVWILVVVAVLAVGGYFAYTKYLEHPGEALTEHPGENTTEGQPVDETHEHSDEKTDEEPAEE